jgi:hypothetical protein
MADKARTNPNQELSSRWQPQRQAASTPSEILCSAAHCSRDLNDLTLPRLPSPRSWSRGLDTDHISQLAPTVDLRRRRGGKGEGLAPQEQRSRDRHHIAARKIRISTLGEDKHPNAGRLIFNAVESILRQLPWGRRNCSTHCDRAI